LTGFTGSTGYDANSHTLITKQDGGSYSSNSQYLLQTTAGVANLIWTAAADDWGIITAAFKEVGSTSTYTPPTPTITGSTQGNF